MYDPLIGAVIVKSVNPVNNKLNNIFDFALIVNNIVPNYYLTKNYFFAVNEQNLLEIDSKRVIYNIIDLNNISKFEIITSMKRFIELLVDFDPLFESIYNINEEFSNNIIPYLEKQKDYINVITMLDMYLYNNDPTDSAYQLISSELYNDYYIKAQIPNSTYFWIESHNKDKNSFNPINKIIDLNYILTNIDKYYLYNPSEHAPIHNGE